VGQATRRGWTKIMAASNGSVDLALVEQAAHCEESWPCERFTA
jgi:hypothetical protein